VVERVTSALDRVDALPAGHGQLDLGVLLRGGDHKGVLGAFADYEHRVSDAWGLFGTARAGLAWDADRTTTFYEGALGGRWRF
jgi:hypothetical protein